VSDPTRGNSGDGHRARRDARRLKFTSDSLYARADSTSDPDAKAAITDLAAKRERDAVRASGGMTPEPDSDALKIITKRIPK
jgi:hypothetical protein